MIAVGDPVLDDLIYLSLESGKPVLSFTPPFTPHEITRFLDTIDPFELSPTAFEAYNRIKSRLNLQSPISISGDHFLFTLDIHSTIEAKLRFNNKIDWYPQNSSVPPLLALPIRLYFSDFIQLYIEPILAMDPGYYRSKDIFTHNITYDMSNIEQTLPLRAYIAMGNSWFNFQLGRDKLSFGTAHLGNLAISDIPEYHEFARVSFFTDFFKYSLLISQMPLDITGIYDSGSIAPSFYRTTQRYLYLHRIDFTPIKSLSISVSEGIMAGNSALEIRYLNPMMIFHSLYSFWNYDKWNGGTNHPEGAGDMNGSIFSLEINWNIIQSFSVYAQFIMNQIATDYKIEQWGVQTSGLGYLAGARHSRTFGDWGAVFHLELIYTDPYLYLNPSPFASLIHMRYLGINPDRFEYSYIGYKRDCIATTLGASFFNEDNLLLTGEFTWLVLGEHYKMFWDWENSIEAYYKSTPSGIPQNLFILALGVKWNINSNFTLRSNISGILSVNNGNERGSNEFGGQASVSLSYQF